VRCSPKSDLGRAQKRLGTAVLRDSCILCGQGKECTLQGTVQGSLKRCINFDRKAAFCIERNTLHLHFFHRPVLQACKFCAVQAFSTYNFEGTAMGVRRNFSKGGAKSTACLSFSGC